MEMLIFESGIYNNYYRKEKNMKISLVLLSAFFLISPNNKRAEGYNFPLDVNGINSYESAISWSFPEAKVLTQKKGLVTFINANLLVCNSVEKYGMEIKKREPNLSEYSYISVKKTDSPTQSTFFTVPSGNKNSWGSLYDIRFDKGSGSIQIGVFPDPNSAIKIFAEYILHTSIGPNKNISKEVGDVSAGWWDEHHNGFRRILFIRDNVVVNVSIFLEKFIDTGGSASVTMEIAKAIDTPLAQGTLGVQRGSILKVPRFSKIEIPTKLQAQTKVEAGVRLFVPETPQDPNSREIEIEKKVPFRAPIVNESETQVTFEVTYITAGCVVTSEQVTLSIIP